MFKNRVLFFGMFFSGILFPCEKSRVYSYFNLCNSSNERNNQLEVQPTDKKTTLLKLESQSLKIKSQKKLQRLEAKQEKLQQNEYQRQKLKIERKEKDFSECIKHLESRIELLDIKIKLLERNNGYFNSLSDDERGEEIKLLKDKKLKVQTDLKKTTEESEKLKKIKEDKNFNLNHKKIPNAEDSSHEEEFFYDTLDDDNQENTKNSLRDAKNSQNKSSNLEQVIKINEGSNSDDEIECYFDCGEMQDEIYNLGVTKDEKLFQKLQQVKDAQDEVLRQQSLIVSKIYSHPSIEWKSNPQKIEAVYCNAGNGLNDVKKVQHKGSGLSFLSKSTNNNGKNTVKNAVNVLKKILCKWFILNKE